jgi:hypothetical protein
VKFENDKNKRDYKDYVKMLEALTKENTEAEKAA